METCRSQVLNLTNCPWSQVNPSQLNGTTAPAHGIEDDFGTWRRRHWTQSCHWCHWPPEGWAVLLIHFDIRHTFWYIYHDFFGWSFMKYIYIYVMPESCLDLCAARWWFWAWKSRDDLICAFRKNKSTHFNLVDSSFRWRSYCYIVDNETGSATPSPIDLVHDMVHERFNCSPPPNCQKTAKASLATFVSPSSQLPEVESHLFGRKKKRLPCNNGPPSCKWIQPRCTKLQLDLLLSGLGMYHIYRLVKRPLTIPLLKLENQVKRFQKEIQNDDDANKEKYPLVK